MKIGEGEEREASMQKTGGNQDTSERHGESFRGGKDARVEKDAKQQAACVGKRGPVMGLRGKRPPAGLQVVHGL